MSGQARVMAFTKLFKGGVFIKFTVPILYKFMTYEFYDRHSKSYEISGVISFIINSDFIGVLK